MKKACIIQLQIVILYATRSSHVFDGSLKLRISACLVFFYRVDSGGEVNNLGGDIFGHREKKNAFDRVSHSE
jgi:hypothetical protein